MVLAEQRVIAAARIRVPGVRAWVLVLAAAILSIPPIARADAALGSDYALVEPPQAPQTPGKIEVIEFFSFGCPACNVFHPDVDPWSKTLARDVVFVRVPVGFGHPAWQNLAKTFYALQSIGAEDRLNNALFHAIHDEHVALTDAGSITAWVTRQGIDGKEFSQAYDSFAVATKTTRAEQLVSAYKVLEIPTLIVDGKYRVVAAKATTNAEWLAIADQLIAKARQDKALKSKTASPEARR